MSLLADSIESAGPRLTRRVLDAMYDDPFWEARYGGRGRKHADEDSAYHVTYLTEALRSDNPAVMTRYAYWLRSVLVPRGMCSAHLDENFERLSQALRDELAAASTLELAPALDILAQARAALRYEAGAGGWLEARAGELQHRVRADVRERFGREPAHTHARVESLLSYLADALQLERPELFVRHVAFLAGLYRTRSESPVELVHTLRCLRESFEREASFGPEALVETTLRALRAAEAQFASDVASLRESP